MIELGERLHPVTDSDINMAESEKWKGWKQYGLFIYDSCKGEGDRSRQADIFDCGDRLFPRGQFRSSDETS
ncbi:MAG: hypothetical protein NT011_02325 [Kiritimatiellaeota bacterium]|nr:hypothetical protein [Kiritimatiellota bacterium]